MSWERREERSNKNDTWIDGDQLLLLVAAYSENIDPADLIEDTVTIGLRLVFSEEIKKHHTSMMGKMHTRKDLIPLQVIYEHRLLVESIVQWLCHNFIDIEIITYNT